MYCVNCGVELAETEIKCPLCQTKVYHPDFLKEGDESFYPKKNVPTSAGDSYWWQAFLTVAFLIPLVVVLACDMRFSGGVTWSGYVVGALILGYVTCVLPSWFKKPNPVVFAPCDFVAIALYLLYIDLMTDGGWFLSFAFPFVGGLGIIVVTVVTLLKYVRRGKLYVFGGAFMGLGGLMLLLEFLLDITFEGVRFIGWSFYPLSALVLLGGFLIFLGICRPARECMERKFFI
jgi:hypothetical protein